MSDTNFIPAQIRPGTHKGLTAIKSATGLPLYILLDTICKAGFANPGLFGVHPSFHKEVKSAIRDSE